MNNTKPTQKRKMAIGVALLSIVVIGIIAGFQLLQNPIDIRDRADEIDACRAMVVTCNVTYSLDSEPKGEKASSPIYLLNEAGIKVRFGGGDNREGEMNFPNTKGETKTIPYDFNQINHDDYFVDADRDGKAKVKCVVPKFEDENESGWAQVRGNPCCTDPEKIQADENKNGVDDSCESGSQDEILCRVTEMSPCYQGQCKCEDIFKTAADPKEPVEGDTVFPYPTYVGGQPGIVDGKVRFPVPLPTCINCSSLKIFALDSRGQKIEPPIKVYPTEKPEPGKKYGACLNEDNKKVNDYGFEYKCNQGQNPDEPGADPKGCREYKFEMKNAYDDPAPEAACVPVEPQSCSLGCKSCCPSCNAEQPQPLMVGVKKRVLKAGIPPESKNEDDFEWELQEGFQCQETCNFGIDNFPDPEWQPNGNFKKGNELTQRDLERGEAYPAPNPNGGKCIAIGENVRLDPHPRANGDTIDWDEYDFKNKQPKPTSAVPTSGPVQHKYEDPGVYDMTLTCRKGNDDPSDDEICVKRIVMKCGGGNPPEGDNPPPGNPPPGGGGSNPVCYDTCVPNVTSCGAGMTCVDVDSGSTGTDYRCVMFPDNECKDMPDGEKEACYCSQPSPSPTPTPGVCRAQVSAKCEPLN